MAFHGGVADEIEDAADEVRDEAGDAADAASDQVEEFVDSGSETINPYVESGEAYVTEYTNEATDQFLNVSDYVYHQASYAFENPVQTGEQMVHFVWGGDGEPPQAVHNWATDRGYVFVGVTAIDKICTTISGLGIIGSVAVGSSGGPITAATYSGLAVSCQIGGFVTAYSEDIMNCDVNNVAVYVRYGVEADVLIVPACG